MNPQEAAASLVERARVGDQNARALLICIPQDAKRGSKRAAFMAKHIWEYIQKAPVGSEPVVRQNRAAPALAELKKRAGSGQFNDELLSLVCSLEQLGGTDALIVACIVIANSKFAVDDTSITKLCTEYMNDEAASLFKFGYEHPVCNTPSEICRAGQVFGHARALQQARLPNTPMTPFSRVVGRECGE